MEIINDLQQKVDLEYPCNWCYKVVAHSSDAIKQCAEALLQNREYTLAPSKQSKGGKYVSMNLDLLVMNEDDRNFIYEALKAHQNIKMVL